MSRYTLVPPRPDMLPPVDELDLLAYLRLHGVSPEVWEKWPNDRVVGYFPKDPEIAALIDRYRLGQAVVEPRAFTEVRFQVRRDMQKFAETAPVAGVTGGSDDDDPSLDEGGAA